MPATLSSALCLTTQLLSTMTSASAAAVASPSPNWPSALSRRSESALFIWQPIVQIWKLLGAVGVDTMGREVYSTRPAEAGLFVKRLGYLLIF